jgi:hypothetical protein
MEHGSIVLVLYVAAHLSQRFFMVIVPALLAGIIPSKFSTIVRYPGVLGGGINPGTFSTMDMDMYHSLLGMG